MASSEKKLTFFSALDNLFNASTYSDLTIKSGTTTFHVHLCLLSLRTSFFGNAIDGGFEEAKEKTVTIKEHSTHAVWRFLKWCYGGEYPVESNTLALGEGKTFIGLSKIDNEQSTEDDLGALKHSSVYFLADMLGVDLLKELAAEKFRAHLKDDWVVNDFSGLVAEIYDKTPESDTVLRDVVVDVAKTRHAELLKASEYKKVLTTYGEFSGVLVFKHMISSVPEPPKKCCPNCANTNGQLKYHCSTHCGGTYNINN